MKRILIAFAIVAAVVAAREAGAQGVAPPAPKCETNADCVPAQCCHPTSCTHKSLAPDCSKVVCTMDCRPNTLDCQNGACECREGACTANIKPGH